MTLINIVSKNIHIKNNRISQASEENKGGAH